MYNSEITKALQFYNFNAEMYTMLIITINVKESKDYDGNNKDNPQCIGRNRYEKNLKQINIFRVVQLRNRHVDTWKVGS